LIDVTSREGSQVTNTLTAVETARRIAAGALTSEAAVGACLARIAEREPAVGAWAFLDPDLALAQARARDAEPARGPLHGVPIGIKDIIDTVDMPTCLGSPIYAGRRPPADAACVALLRAAGAVIMGKTVTTEFAALTPGKTANPRNTAHSPGGSSSGSAAAVADGMVPAALGTQTVGSTIRPATFCGAVGFKPTFGTFTLQGVAAQAETYDTLGIITRSVDDASLLSAVLLGVPQAFDDPPPRLPPRIAFCPTPHWPQAQPSTVRVMAEARTLLAQAGAIVDELPMSADYDRLLDAQWRMFLFECARVMSFERTQRRDGLSPRLLQVLDDGMTVPVAEYRAAARLREQCCADIATVFDRYDAILTPAAAGEAPVGVAAASDLLFQRLWTTLRLPAITLPGFTGDTGLPVGIQLVGRHGGDGALLAVAKWIEEWMPRG